MTRAAYNQRSEKDRLLTDLMRVDEDNITVQLMDMFPDEWHTVGWDIETRPAKTKVTLYLETNVVKFFKEMGQGYQDRINRILAVYMRMCVQNYMATEEKLRQRARDNGYDYIADRAERRAEKKTQTKRTGR